MRYDFDQSKFIGQMLPSFMRKPRAKAFLESLLKPMADIYALFATAKALFDVQVNYNAQELLFSFVLNNIFDPVQRRIVVETNTQVGVYISAYLKQENQPRTPAYRIGEGPKIVVGRFEDAIVTDFFVRVPAALLAAQQTAIGRIVKKYKLAGKTFEFIAT